MHTLQLLVNSDYVVQYHDIFYEIESQIGCVHRDSEGLWRRVVQLN